MLRKLPVEYCLEHSVLLDSNFSEILSEVFPLEGTVNDEACREILTAVKEALVKDNHAVQVCEASMTLEDFLCEVMEDSATLLVQKAAFVRVAQMNCEQMAEEEEDSLKVLGCYLIAVFVGALFLGEHHSQIRMPPRGNLVL